MDGHVHPGLSGSYYWDPAVFDEERERLWRGGWQLMGRSNDVVRPGDFATRTIGNDPIVAVRGEDLSVRAFLNICRHRSAPVADGCGNRKMLTCPYHGWTYDLRGHLIDRPHSDQFSCLDPSAQQLFTVRSSTWKGFLFLNIDGRADPLTAHMDGMDDHVAGYRTPFDDLRQVDTWHRDEPVNWKLLVENYVEHYHFPFRHAGLSKLYNYRAARVQPTGRHCAVFMPYADTPPPGELQNRWQPGAGSYQAYIFPNLFLGTGRWSVSFVRLTPSSPTSTRIETTIYQTDAQRAARAFVRYDDSAEAEEDFAVCRALQAAVRSNGWGTTALARDYEVGIAHFHRVFLQEMGVER